MEHTWRREISVLALGHFLRSICLVEAVKAAQSRTEPNTFQIPIHVEQ